METTRQNKVARLLQKDISEILQLEIRSILSNAMVSVTKVRPAPDLSIARVYVSIFVTGKGSKTEVLNNITLHTKEIRKHLGNRAKNQLRIIPDLEFFIDDSLDYIENI
ncbi:MAG: 30S ribosome-binding factor RbfA, partial [Bacteroidetes bacterium]|nr:30S ribosome-binding factor RbfA [Bacteroidota bacterium]